MAVLAPMPRASVRMAISVKPGFFASTRMPKRMSCQNAFKPDSRKKLACRSTILELCAAQGLRSLLEHERLCCQRSLQLDAVEIVPSRHIGQNHFVADLEAVEDFDGVHRSAAELYVDAHGLRAISNNFEETDGAIGLTMNRATDVEDVFQIFDFDGAIHAGVGARAERERFVKSDVHGNGAVLHGRINPGNVAVHDAVAGFHGGLLADGYVFCLRLRDFDFGLQLLWISNAREVGSRGNALTFLDGNELKHAVKSSAQVQSVELALFQLIEDALLLDAGFLGAELGGAGIRGDLGAFAFELETNGELADFDAREVGGDFRTDALRDELFVHLVLNLGLFVVAADGGLDGLLVHEVAIDLDFEVSEVGFRALQLILSVKGILLELRVAEFEDDGVGLDDCAGAEDDAVHASFGLRSNPMNIFGDERA